MSAHPPTAARRITAVLIFPAIFAGALVITSSTDPAAGPVEVVAEDCWLVPPRGLPQPCGDPPLSNANLRDIGIVITGCALGALNGGGPWGCAVGATSGYAGVLWGNTAKDDEPKNRKRNNRTDRGGGGD
jgi:hypothetical protein